MKKGLIIFLVLVSFTLSFAVQTLNVYTYESMKWLSKSEAIKEFEKQYNSKVNIVKIGDAGNVLARLKLERNNPKSDVVIGLDQSLALKAIQEKLVSVYRSPNMNNLKSRDLIFDKNFYFTPFDYGSIAVVYNPEKLKDIPKSFNDLTKMEKSLVIQDPRSSSTGQAFLLWTIGIYKDNWKDFWKNLKPSVLAVTASWDDAFAKLESGEVPMMVSYATDGAYSYEYYKSTKYKAFVPAEGGYAQIEGAAVVKGAKNEALAKKFIDFILTDKFQKEIPLNQWMFPVIKTQLPESFKYALIPNKLVSVSQKDISENIEKWLKEWEEIMIK